MQPNKTISECRLVPTSLASNKKQSTKHFGMLITMYMTCTLAMSRIGSTTQIRMNTIPLYILELYIYITI